MRTHGDRPVRQVSLRKPETLGDTLSRQISMRKKTGTQTHVFETDLNETRSPKCKKDGTGNRQKESGLGICFMSHWV